MKVALFSESFRPLVNGVAYSVQSFARQLTRMGHEVHVFAPHYPGYEDPNDFPVHRYPGILTTYEQGYNIPVPFWPLMLNVMRQVNFDLIHTQSPFFLGMTGARWAKRLRLPLVTTAHTVYTEYVHYVYPLPPALSKVGMQTWTRLYCNRADRIIVPTEPIRELLIGYGVTRPITVNATGVDVEAIRRADPTGLRRELGISEAAELIVFVGRLAQEKSVDVLIRAFRRIAPAHATSHLLLVGGGQEEESLKAQVDAWGLSARVTFAGWRSPEERNRMLRAGDLFLYPSVTDTQGLVLCEALAAGLPCVAADAYGSKAVLRDGVDGLLTRPTSLALSKAALELLRNPERRAEMACAAHEDAKRFSERQAALRLCALYEEVLAEPPRPRPFSLGNLTGHL